MGLCPPSNVPWLYALLGIVKQGLEDGMRMGFAMKSSQTNQDSNLTDDDNRNIDEAHDSTEDHHALTVHDQEWFDEERQRWWYQGTVICYLCGRDDCEDNAKNSCERRRREILNIDIGKRRRRR